MNFSTSISELRPELTDNGGHFYRCDFQVHTPRDSQWIGKRPANHEERKVYAAEFVLACRTKGLHAVAITDHHDFAFFPYIYEAARAETTSTGESISEKDRLVVFPGLELTLSVPCQALLILDADFPHDHLDDVLKAMHFEPIDQSLEMVPQVAQLDDSNDLLKFHEKLDKSPWLKGRYIIFPHVKPSGHQTLIRTSFQDKYKAMPCVGGYLDGDMSVFVNHPGEVLILAGKDRAWGSKRLALFQTSDSRSVGFDELGKCSTWVKWSKPTAEALRQACLAQESRVSQNEPAFPNVWISRIIVSNSKFMGRVNVALNPQFNALIGGRGTGKSTILDYLRWALCDQPAVASEDDEVADPRIRQRKLIQATLLPLDAIVEIHFTINGIAHIARRYARTGEAHLKVGNGEFETVREAVIQSLLPIQAYSQKQLSSVAIRQDELLRFITFPIQRELEDIDRNRANLSAKLRENYGTLQRHRILKNEIERSRLQVGSLAEQTQSLRNSLAGLSDSDRLLLDGKAQYDNTKSAVAQWAQQTEIAKATLSDVLIVIDRSLAHFEMPDDVPEAARSELRTLAGLTRNALVNLRANVAQVSGEFDSDLVKSDGVSDTAGLLSRRIDSFENNYTSIKQRSSANEAKLRELSALEEQQNEVRDLLQKQEREFVLLGDPITVHTEVRNVLASLNSDRSQALAIQCADLSASSDDLIRANLEVGMGFAEAQEKFKGLISGSNVRGAKIEEFFIEISRETDPVETWEMALAELEYLMLQESDVDVRSEQTPILTRLGLTVADQKKIAPRISPDGWLDLSLTPLTDHPEFKYRSKEGEYIPFNFASVGQQATALLTALLAQERMPLVIDQPEDDLDTETVQQIVSKIWESKNRRQLIFSSHNANLVVNGDADLVLVCAYASPGDQSAGQIKLEGAIDVEDVRSEITGVMEGGEKAFLLRKEKYGF